MTEGSNQAEARLSRMARVRDAMVERDVDALVLSLGADLPWLSGYEAMPLERPTALVVTRDETPTLFVPELEAPRVRLHEELFKLQPWKETESAVDLIAAAIGARRTIAISDRAWASFLLGLQSGCPDSRFVAASTVTAPLRERKDDAEIAALLAAGRAADAVADALLRGDIRLIGRSERAVSEEIAKRLLDAGHQRVNFSIVASGPNSASPHHEPGTRTIEEGDPVVCDFGGAFALSDGEVGYCSDTTRTVVAGEPTQRFVELYSVLERAQEAAVSAVKPGSIAEEIDAVGRSIIGDAGYGEFFIHRIGHGIGIEEHEDPYIVSGNRAVLKQGHAFSIEPGIYLPNDAGARIEDIVVVGPDGPIRCNVSPRGLVSVGV